MSGAIAAEMKRSLFESRWPREAQSTIRPRRLKEVEVLKVEKSNTQSKFLNSSMTLDKLLDSQRSPNDKSGIGLNKVEISAPKKPDTGPPFVERKSICENVCIVFLL